MANIPKIQKALYPISLIDQNILYPFKYLQKYHVSLITFLANIPVFLKKTLPGPHLSTCKGNSSHISVPYGKVFRIIPEFRMLRLTELDRLYQLRWLFFQVAKHS